MENFQKLSEEQLCKCKMVVHKISPKKIKEDCEVLKTKGRLKTMVKSANFYHERLPKC